MINKTPHYAYFTLSFNNIIRHSFGNALLLFLDYYTVLIHLIEGITLGFMPSSYKGHFTKDFFMNNLSVFFHFRKLKYGLTINSIPVYHWSLLVIILLFQLFFFSYYYCLTRKVVNELFHRVVINFYDYFYFRMLSIFVFDVFINYLTALAYSSSISPYFIFIILFIIMLVVYLYTFMRYFLLFFAFIAVKENKLYPFDNITKQFDIFLLVIKLLLCFQNNIYLLQVEINYLIRCFMIMLFASLLLQLFSLVYYFTAMPALFFMNYTSHKLRLYFCIISFLWSVVSLFQGYHYIRLYYITGIATIVLCLSLAIGFNTKQQLMRYVLCDMTPFNQLLMLLEISGGDVMYQSVYREKIGFHLRNCDNCLFCDFYKKSLAETPIETTTDHRELEHIFNCFLEAFIDNAHKNKSCMHLIYEDLFKMLKRTFDRKSSTCFQSRYCFQSLIRKYMARNEISVAMNLMLLYQNRFENQTQENMNQVNMIKIYIVLVHKIKKIIKKISSFISNDNKSPRKFLELGKDIHSLKKNSQMEFLLNRKNSGDYCVNLIIFIYEEITNIPINKERGMIKDEIPSYEDMLHLQYSTNKNIIILFDPSKRVSSIKKAGMDMFHFVGVDLTSLFPKEIRPEGERRFYEAMNHSNGIKEFDFMIQTHQKKYAVFQMRFALLYEDLNADLYINGEYSLSQDDIIFTRYQKDFGEQAEMLYGNSTKLLAKNSKDNEPMDSCYDLLMFKKEQTQDHTIATLNGVKVLLKLRYSITTEYYCYNVYMPAKTEMKHTSGTPTSLFENNQNGKSIIYKFEDATSYCNSGSSVFSVQSHSLKEQAQMSLNIEKRYKQYQARFIQTTRLTLVFCIIIIIFSVISLVIELDRNNTLLESYDVYTQLRAVNRLFYNTITSILAVVCIGNLDSPTCVNYYKEYTMKYNEENGVEYPSFNYSLYENPLKVVDFGSGLSKLKSLIYVLDDPKATTIFYHWFDYTSLSIVDNRIEKFSENTTFVNALQILFNGLMIIITSNKYWTHPVYIISLNDYDFSNIYSRNALEEWQIEYYNLVINYQKYLDNWVNIQISLSDNTNSKLMDLSSLVIICLNISNVLHLLLFSLLFYFIYSFTNLFIFNMNKLMLKLSKEAFITFFIQKYDMLCVLSNFFEKNPVQLIKEVGNLYVNYKKIPKTPLNQGDVKESEKQQMVDYFPFKDYYEIVAKFYYFIFFILAYYLLLFIVFLSVWCVNIEKILTVFNIITDNTVAACSGYNIFALAQLMILVNQTQSDMSAMVSYEGDNYLEYETLRSLEVVVRLEVQRKGVSNLMKRTNDFIDLDCDTFYSFIKDKRFEEIDKEHPEEKFRENYPSFCKTFSIMLYKNDIVFYKAVFYEIHKIINSITKNSYENMLGYLIQGDIFFLSDLQFLLYRPFRSWFNDVVYSDAINSSINLEKTILFSILGITIASEVVIFLFLYLELFRKLKKINGILIGVKNVFKIAK